MTMAAKDHFPTLVWLVFAGIVVYSMAPFIARWLLWVAVIVVIIVGMVIANQRINLTA